ncbi:helix-turn-helix domain-containing protein [Streptomyces luteireticuli]|uniref:helix-turn-helix domain-containing protein n=1 Tax=Streptomyces luteireticuli TaxID=173858 RepID=UPI0035576945
MASETSQPPMAWRLCGNQVKLWRQDAGVSREELGQEAGYGSETIRAMEQGRRRPTQRLLDIADEMCGARGKLRAASAYLQPESVPERIEAFLDAEARAIAQCHYQTLLIPGLLQTEEYARALLSAHCPPVDDRTVEERLSLRMSRQERLRKQDVLFSFVLYEAALHTGVGGPEVMNGQLSRLLDVGGLRNVSVQVLLTEHGRHGWLDGPFTLFETDERERYLYMEAPGMNGLFEERGHVGNFSQRFGMLRAQALNFEDSAAHIRKLAEEWRSTN